MPKPACKKENLSLLGFITYLAKFLPRLSEVAQPLRDLTRANGKFIWSEQHGKAFDEVKKLVANYPVLRYHNINDEVIIQCRVMPANEVLVQHSFRTGNQLRLQQEHCLQLNKGAHR